jgi:hypothetical protein
VPPSWQAKARSGSLPKSIEGWASVFKKMRGSRVTHHFITAFRENDLGMRGGRAAWQGLQLCVTRSTKIDDW